MSNKASATSKTLEVLKLIANTKQQLGVSEIARLLSINKSTAFGILRTLHQGAYVFKDVSTKKYTVGDELIKFSRMISEDKSLAHVARPFLESLAGSVDETVFLGVCESAAIKVIDVIEARKSLTLSSPIGTKLPIAAGAAGKAYLASLRNEEVIALLRARGLTSWTKTSIIEIDRFLAELEATRKDGFALDREEYIAGVCSVASPITVENRAAGIIWVAAFVGSMDHSKALEVSRAIKETAQLLTARLASGTRRPSGREMDMQGYPGWRVREGLAARKARLTPVTHEDFGSYVKA